jgi:hypothetical protein
VGVLCGENGLKCHDSYAAHSHPDHFHNRATVSPPDGRSLSLFLEFGDLIAIGSMFSHSLINESSGMPRPVSKIVQKLTNTRRTASGKTSIACSHFYGKVILLCSLGFSPHHVD